MASDLIIGPLDSGTWDYVASVCKRSGLELPISYRGEMENSLSISLLNEASYDFFDNYAAGLEGLRGPDAITRTTFRNLPWWLESFWLPLEFDPPTNEDGAFVGSSVRLLDDLARIKQLAEVDIAKPPPGYAGMRNNYEEWFRSSNDKQLSEGDTIKWIWNALHDSAELSIQRNFPISLAP